MAVEVDDLYSNLNQLLADICRFLTDEANYEKLSPYARKQADELLSRSKKQLQEIAKISDDNTEYDGAYVDMERKSDASNEEDKNNIYSSVEETTVTTQTVVQPQPHPYANLPAKELFQDLKYGTLSWKCKIILKFEKVRRIYAGVHDNWLLVYSTEKDVKPLQTFNLKFHKAKPVVSKQNKNPSQDFELISSLAEGKSYYFLAMTHKDMLQWTSHINRCYDKLNNSEKISLSEEEMSETYDKISELNSPQDMVDDEDVYVDLETYAPEVVRTPNKPPDLPARRCIKTTPLPSIPTPKIENNNDNISTASSTYDPVQSQTSRESNSSFSEEDDEDNIYEVFVQVKPQINGVEKSKEFNVKSVSSTRSSVEKPKPAAKPKILPEKTRHITMKK